MLAKKSNSKQCDIFLDLDLKNIEKIKTLIIYLISILENDPI